MRHWGCPNGHTESRVRDTARDEDGYVVRHRQCAICRAFWTTQEVPIDPDAYWTRAYSRNQARARLFRKEKKVCHRCDATYQCGSYRGHVTSKAHTAVLVDGQRDRAKARRYQRDWKRRHRAYSTISPVTGRIAAVRSSTG